MPEVTGLGYTLLWATVGGFLGEWLRIANLLREGQRPTGTQVLGSIGYAVTGGFAVMLLGWNTSQPIILVMATGCGFPLIFGQIVGLVVKAQTSKFKDDGTLMGGSRKLADIRLIDYLAGTF